MAGHEFDPEVLARVGLDRRAFIKRLIAGAAFAVPAIQSFDLAGLSKASAQACTPTTTSLLSDPNPSALGQAVTLTATVQFAVSGSRNADNGTVEFFDGTTSLGTASIDSTTKTAVLTTSSLAAGPHTLTATYLGGTGQGTTLCSSTSAPVIQTVTGAYPLQVDAPPGGAVPDAAAAPVPGAAEHGRGGDPLPAEAAGVAGLTAAAALAYRRFHPAPEDG